MRLNGARLQVAARPIEIWIGGRGPQMLRLAGELADGALLNGVPHVEMERVIGRIRGGAARYVSDEMLEQFVFVGDQKTIRRRLGEMIAKHGFDQLALILPEPEMAEVALTTGAAIVRNL